MFHLIVFWAVSFFLPLALAAQSILLPSGTNSERQEQAGPIVAVSQSEQSIEPTYTYNYFIAPFDVDSSLFLTSYNMNIWQYVAKIIRINDYNQIRHIASHIIALNRISKHPHCCQLEYWDRYNTNNVLIITKRNYLASLKSLQERRIEMIQNPWVILTLLRDMAKALGHVHSQKIAHLNVHPGSIYLSSRGKFILDGFDHADIEADHRGANEYYQFTGAWGYASPDMVETLYQSVDVWREDWGRVPSYPADIWSLGAVIYEAMTGELPFYADDELDASAMFKKMENEHPQMALIADVYGEDCADLISRMLSFASDLRPTADEVLKSECLAGFSGIADMAFIRQCLMTVPAEPVPRHSPDHALSMHFNHRTDPPEMADRFWQGLQEAIHWDNDYLDVKVRFVAFDHNPAGFFDGPRFKLLRAPYCYKAFLISLKRNVEGESIDENQECMLVAEHLDAASTSIAMKGNELVVLDRLGLLRGEPFLFYRCVAVIRRDSFLWPLTDVLRTCSLEMRHLSSLILDLFQEIAKANQLGVVLCRLQTGSLGVRSDGSLCVLDYRHAIHTDAKLFHNRKMWSNELQYVEPEAMLLFLGLKGPFDHVDQRWDAWSAGVIAFEIATGKLPFTLTFPGRHLGSDEFKYYMRDCFTKTEAIDFGLLEGRVSPAIADIIRGLLCADPERRVSLAGFDTCVFLRRLENQNPLGLMSRPQSNLAWRQEIAEMMPEPDFSFSSLAESVSDLHFCRFDDRIGVSNDAVDEEKAKQFQCILDYLKSYRQH